MMAIHTHLRRAMDRLHPDTNESVTLYVMSDPTRDSDYDLTENYSSSSVKATSIQEITDEMRDERPGWFDGGTHVAFFKYSVGGISRGNKLLWNSEVWQIVRVRKETTLGNVIYQEALLEKSELLA